MHSENPKLSDLYFQSRYSCVYNHETLGSNGINIKLCINLWRVFMWH